MLRGVAVVWMPVENIERAKSFYRDLLGKVSSKPY
jgi:predicted enzyme related to lactoylglutathione lyase